MKTCAWCSEAAKTEVNLAKGGARKLQMVPVCHAHKEMVEQRQAEERDAREKAKKTKGVIQKWW